MNKKVIAWKLLTSRKMRQGVVELLKDPRVDKRTLTLKLLTNRKVRQGAVEFLKDPDMHRMLLQRAIQRFCRP